MYKHILISTDGSETANLGVDHGLALASATGAAVTLLTATSPFPVVDAAMGAGTYQPVSVLNEYEDAQAQAAAEILKAAAQKAEALGVTVKTLHIANAFPADAILENAKSLGCDLICMASHGRRGVKRMLLGSQASEVVSRSTIPVLIVRH